LRRHASEWRSLRKKAFKDISNEISANYSSNEELLKIPKPKRQFLYTIKKFDPRLASLLATQRMLGPMGDVYGHEIKNNDIELAWSYPVEWECFWCGSSNSEEYTSKAPVSKKWFMERRCSKCGLDSSGHGELRTGPESVQNKYTVDDFIRCSIDFVISLYTADLSHISKKLEEDFSIRKGYVNKILSQVSFSFLLNDQWVSRVNIKFDELIDEYFCRDNHNWGLRYFKWISGIIIPPNFR
jgi:hypothetical protein